MRGVRRRTTSRLTINMDFYVILGARARRDRRRHQAGVPAPGAAVSSRDQPGRPRGEAMFHADHGGVRDAGRSGAAAAVRRGGQAASRRPTGERRSSSPASISRSRRTGAQAATFTELFAEVLHPVGRGGQRPAGAGRGSPRGADGLVRRMRCSGVERQVVVTRQDVVRSVPRHADSVATPEGRCAALPGDRQASAGRAATWSSRRRARRAAGPAGSGMQRCGACGGHGRAVRSEGGRRSAYRRACATARGCASPERGHAGATADGPAICMSTVHVRAAPVVPARGRRSASCRSRSRCTKRCSARGSTCRRSTGRCGCDCRRARRAGQRFRVQRPRRADGGRRPRRPDRGSRGSCCRRSSTNARRS